MWTKEQEQAARHRLAKLILTPWEEMGPGDIRNVIGGEVAQVNFVADSEFIVYAPDDFAGSFAEIDRLRAVNAECISCLKMALGAMGAHGPCESNGCKECKATWLRIKAAIARAALGE